MPEYLRAEHVVFHMITVQRDDRRGRMGTGFSGKLDRRFAVPR
jgi:hypothetical protein